jgi:hypothetical protein
MARKVRQIRRKGKHVGLVPAPVTTAPDTDARIALIQALIPVALDKVMEELNADVERLAGARYAVGDSEARSDKGSSVNRVERQAANADYSRVAVV